MNPLLPVPTHAVYESDTAKSLVSEPETLNTTQSDDFKETFVSQKRDVESAGEGGKAENTETSVDEPSTHDSEIDPIEVSTSITRQFEQTRESIIKAGVSVLIDKASPKTVSIPLASLDDQLEPSLSAEELTQEFAPTSLHIEVKTSPKLIKEAFAEPIPKFPVGKVSLDQPGSVGQLQSGLNDVRRLATNKIQLPNDTGKTSEIPETLKKYTLLESFVDGKTRIGQDFKKEFVTAEGSFNGGKMGMIGGSILSTMQNFSISYENIDANAKFQITELQTAQTSLLNASGQVSTSQISLPGEAKIQMPVNIVFGQTGWANMVAERTALLAAQNIKFAELRLDPPELGPLQVKVSVNQDQLAQVSFVATNVQVREALDQTLIRLREMLAEQGLDLANVDVSDQSFNDSKGGSEPSEMPERFDEQGEELEPPPRMTGSTYVATYSIDHYV